MQSLLELIQTNYGSFSKGQRRIADYISAEYDEAAFMTASRLGDKVGVSESTVVRFAYSLGLDGYPELQEAMQEMLRHRLTSAQRIRLASGIPQDEVLQRALTDDIANIRATMELVDNDHFHGAVQAILNAKRVYVLGNRSSVALAQFMTYYLGYICNNVCMLGGTAQDIYEKMLWMDEEDVCIGICFPRYSSRTVNGMRFAKGQGAKVVALTDAPTSPAVSWADHVLYARSNMAGFADSLVAPLSLINAIIMSLGLAKEEAAYTHLNALEKIWREEGVYMVDEYANPDDSQKSGGRNRRRRTRDAAEAEGAPHRPTGRGE